ncbi:FAD-dependent monooxygenase [Saccharopolyspora spinosa]|uniref:FAD binding domain-containing protein n=1 Tax=Saccharopolyspora spinosa TaxID=60894 RepID=UPI0002ED818B|nr:FAD-dependent monooxygenase [Saccharopolyspora spinosa]
MTNTERDRTHTRQAIVVGGSIGGLGAAALLRRQGWEVTVYERSPVTLAGAGAGIVVHPSTVRHFVEHRGMPLEQISCGAKFARVLDGAGTALYEEPCRYHFTSWTTLYATYLDSVGRGNYVLGEQLVALEQDLDTAWARFASGRVAEADLVVCADGIGSTARELLVGQVTPAYSGYVGWRGVVEVDRLSPHTAQALTEALTYGVINDSHIVVYPIPDTDPGSVQTPKTLNYVWYRNVESAEHLRALLTGKDGVERSLAMQPGLVRDEFTNELRAAADAELPPVLAELVNRTHEPFLQVVVDLEVPEMAFGRVALIGDAAFAARPHAAAGTAKALENSWALAEALETFDDVEAALNDWSPAQLELGSNLVHRSRRLGERAQFERAWTPGDPDLRFGLYGPGR